MNEPELKEMSRNRVMVVLIELKHECLSRTPSKYYYALGHAIRCLENAPEPPDAGDREKASENSGFAE